MIKEISIKLRCKECGGRLWFVSDPAWYDIDEEIIVECSLCKKKYAIKFE